MIDLPWILESNRTWIKRTSYRISSRLFLTCLVLSLLQVSDTFPVNSILQLDVLIFLTIGSMTVSLLVHLDWRRLTKRPENETRS